MDVLIKPSQLSGCVDIPASKSAAHRAIICAGLASGESSLRGVETTDDMRATCSAITALGGKTQTQDKTVFIKGIDTPEKIATIDCIESGSTLRFFVPIAAALGVQCSFTGKGKLPTRPMQPLYDVLTANGAEIAQCDGEICTVGGNLKAGRFIISGDVSSQYITGLLFALPLLEGDSEIILTSPLVSKGYVDMTVQALKNFSVEVIKTQTGYYVPGNQVYMHCNKYLVEGDYSSAAFWLCAGAISGEVTVAGLDPDSLQGDREILDVLKRFGADVQCTAKGVQVIHNKLTAIELDVEQIPDLVPIVAVVAAFAMGTTTIYNASRLRIKESDRLQAMSDGLGRLGVKTEVLPDKIIIHGCGKLSGGVVSSYSDHRIAMAFSIAALFSDEMVTVKDAQCVSKSYPDFYKHFAQMGGILSVI